MVGPGEGMPLGLVALNSDVLSPADGEWSRPARSRCAATRSPAASGTSPASTSRSTAARAWSQAELLEDLGPWAWRHWRIVLDLEPGEHEIVVRAWDSSAATQPEDEAALWNPKGYVNNARPRIRIHVRPSDD